jgi:hypothetical protein
MWSDNWKEHQVPDVTEAIDGMVGGMVVERVILGFLELALLEVGEEAQRIQRSIGLHDVLHSLLHPACRLKSEPG